MRSLSATGLLGWGTSRSWFLVCRILGNNRSRHMNGLFKVKHPPTRNSIGFLGSANSWAVQSYCMWRDKTEMLSAKHERGVQHRETTAAQRILILHKHELWNILRMMTDAKVWVNTSCSALRLHSCFSRVVQRYDSKSSSTNNTKCCRDWNYTICCIPSHLNRFRSTEPLDVGAKQYYSCYSAVSETPCIQESDYSM